MFRTWWLLLALAAIGSGCASSTASGPSPATAPAPRPEAKLLSPKQILERMEASPVKYTLRPLEDCDVPESRIAATLWPRSAPEYQFPVVGREADGEVSISEMTARPEAFRLLGAAEEPFQAKRWEEAAAVYERALAVEPGFVPALLYEGDTFLFRGQPGSALPFYARAREANPADHRGYYFAANALFALGSVEEAVPMYAEALARRPRHEHMRTGIESRLRRMGRRLRGDVVPFKGFARKTSDGVEICTQTTGPWIAWSTCKGFWIGDAGHRKEMLGIETAVFSTREETECLLALLQGYERVRAKEPDPDLDELSEIAQEGSLLPYVMVELATRIDPHATLRVPAEQRPGLVKYVLGHVLVEGAGPERPVRGSSSDPRQVMRRSPLGLARN